ncbi:MAG: antibiotic biosynthesis monooxygenase [Thermomicrobiales bacterium]|nr:antibiotic biosynthesis monooxygenase [Thermomicrobiales bacterium]
MAATSTSIPTTGKVVTVVTQTRVQPEHADDFARWQQRVTDVVATFPGFLDHQVMPPSPPVQDDWVIVQRFASVEEAQAWLASFQRQELLREAQGWFAGPDDIHLITDDAAPEASSVSAVISARIEPGQEEAYRRWGQRIAAAQARYPGFQGFRINPPIPGVQDDWVTVLQFDNEADLNAWMTSPERQHLLEEAKAFTAETHSRTVRSGFSQWFRVDGGPALAPAWKQNMLVLLALYPVVFLFGFFVGGPLLGVRLGLPFWLSLFIGNVASVIILNWVVPWVSGRFGWWLHPAGEETERRNVTGIAILIALYVLLLMAFSQFPAGLG